MSTAEIIGLAVGIINAGISAVIGFFVQSLNTKTQKIEKLEDKLEASVSEKIESNLSSIKEDIDRILDRLDKGEERFRKLEEKDHQLQVDVLQELRKLQAAVATKDDLKRIQDQLDRIKA